LGDPRNKIICIGRRIEVRKEIDSEFRKILGLALDFGVSPTIPSQTPTKKPAAYKAPHSTISTSPMVYLSFPYQKSKNPPPTALLATINLCLCGGEDIFNI
jgi:hypothetical protein